MPVNRFCTGPGNPGKYLNFSLAISRTEKSLKMVEGLGNPGNLFTQEIKCACKTLRNSHLGRSNNLMCITHPGKAASDCI